jgi:hypothetical protein
VNEPAVSSVNGVTKVPPMTGLQKALIGGGVALLAAALLGRFVRERD